MTDIDKTHTELLHLKPAYASQIFTYYLITHGRLYQRQRPLFVGAVQFTRERPLENTFIV